MAARIEPVPGEVLAGIVKAYDIRGICPDELSLSAARGIGYAFATWTAATQIVMARDMRPSGVSLAEAFADGVVAAGADVIDIGLASTDLLYFASGHLAMPGAMLTGVAQSGGLQRHQAVRTGCRAGGCWQRTRRDCWTGGAGFAVSARRRPTQQP